MTALEGRPRQRIGPERRRSLYSAQPDDVGLYRAENEHDVGAVELGRAHAVERRDEGDVQVAGEPLGLALAAPAVHDEAARVVAPRGVADRADAVADPVDA